MPGRTSRGWARADDAVVWAGAKSLADAIEDWFANRAAIDLPAALSEQRAA